MQKRKSINYGSVVDFDDFEENQKDDIVELSDELGELEELEELDEFGEFEAYESRDIEEIEEIEELAKFSDIVISGDFPNKKEKGQYVNEHMLSILMSMFRNWDGSAHKSIIFRDDYKEARAKYEILKAEYIACTKEGHDKRSQKIQVPFMQMLELSSKVYPTDKEITELYNMITLISNRCVGVYGRNKGIEADDIISTSFERWIKYRHNFDPLKRSKISGTRVNAFAYMTQLIKNTIFEASNKIKKQKMLEERLRGDMMLHESLGSATITIAKPLSDEDQSQGNTISFSTMEGQPINLDSDIIRCLMHKAHNFNNLKLLILEVEKEGFTREEIFKVIDEYGLMGALQDVINRNIWAF